MLLKCSHAFYVIAHFVLVENEFVLFKSIHKKVNANKMAQMMRQNALAIAIQHMVIILTDGNKPSKTTAAKLPSSFEKKS